MKTKEEILFEQMQPDDQGGIKPLTTDEILAAMEAYVDEKLTLYIMRKTGAGASLFEAQRLVKQFNTY